MDTRRFNIIKASILLSIAVFGSSNMYLSYLLTDSGLSTPSLYTGLMFFGEFLCVFIYPFVKKEKIARKIDIINTSERSPLNKSVIEKTGKYSCCLVSLIDYISTMLIFYSVNHIWIEIVVLLMMIPIYFLFIYNKYILKRKTYKHKALGIIIFTFGILITTAFFYFFYDNHAGNVYLLLNIGLMAISGLLRAIYLLLDEKIIWTLDMTSEEMNTIQGLTGMAISALFYVPISIIDNSKFDPSSLSEPFLKMIDSQVIVLVFFYILSMFLYNYMFLIAIKISDSLSVYIMNSGRMMIITIIFFVLDPESGYTGYIQIIFSFIIILGLLIYNEVIILPFYGLDKSAKLSIKENKLFREKRKENWNWMQNLDKLLSN